MATYLQLHIVEGMTEEEIISDGNEETFCITEIKTPNINIAQYSYGWALFSKEEIPSCVGTLKKMFWLKDRSECYDVEQYLVFAELIPQLADKICNVISESWSRNEGQKIISPDVLGEFLGLHMGKKVFLIEL